MLEVFKARGDGVLLGGNPAHSSMGLELDSLKTPFNPRHFVILRSNRKQNTPLESHFLLLNSQKRCALCYHLI